MRDMGNGFVGVGVLALVLVAVPFIGGSESVDRIVESSANLVLVENGESRMPIVIFEGAPPKTRRAADELAEYIEKVSGARPPVIEGLPEPLPEHAIWVGYQPKLDNLFPEIDFNFQHPEEILLAANDSHLVIAGRDRWDPKNMRVRFYTGREVDGAQMEYGTVNAVYTFLQDRLDVRWLWPGESGEDIVPRATIAFAPFHYRFHPRFRGRADIFRWSALRFMRGPGVDWARFQRVQLDSLQISGGHPFGGWWNRFHESDPEFFALQPDGTRGEGGNPFPDARMVKLCKANAALWDQWLADVETELVRNPTQRTFGANANDGGYQGYCICDKCLAWDHKDGRLVRHMWRGISQDYVAMSDRQVTFANTLARMLKARFPDRDFFVSGMAYGNSRPTPVAAVPDDNVIFSVVANFHNRPSGHNIWSGGDHRDDLAAWGRIAPNLGWRPNLGNGAGWSDGFLNIAPRRVIDDLRFAADHNVIALFFDTVWEHWANQGPHYYLLAQMAWNPYADGEAILTDYYRRAFGPASGELTAYWTLVDETSEVILFNGKPAAEAWDDAFYRQAYGHLDRATEAASDAPEILPRRIAFVRAGLDYMRLYHENRALLARLDASDGRDADAEAAARANWREIQRIIADHPMAFGHHIRLGPRTASIDPDRYRR